LSFRSPIRLAFWWLEKEKLDPDLIIQQEALDLLSGAGRFHCELIPEALNGNGKVFATLRAMRSPVGPFKPRVNCVAMLDDFWHHVASWSIPFVGILLAHGLEIDRSYTDCSLLVNPFCWNFVDAWLVAAAKQKNKPKKSGNNSGLPT